MSQENVEIAERLTAASVSGVIAAVWEPLARDVVATDLRARVTASDVPVEEIGASAATFRDGKIVEWITGVPSQRAAVAAVGLSE